MKKEKKEKM